MAKQAGQILVVDDDPDVLTAARLLIKRHFASVVVLDNPEKIRAAMAEHAVDVVLLDMNFASGRNTGKEGLNWLTRIREDDPEAVVILMTAYGDAELAVEAMQLGATDFVLKPWQNEKLIATLGAGVALRRSRGEVRQLKARQAALSDTAPSQLIAQSAEMQRVLQLVSKAAPTDVNVLIRGENGTGKEVIAREIWRQSQRSDAVFLGVDLGSLPETLFESELFGHVKGAFTDAVKDRMGRFQAADGGTLFLDEIGNLPLHLQAKLLRTLETREVMPVGADRPSPFDVRLIAATNANLEDAIDNETFRPDLLYRINTIQIELPPLRSRQADIPLLAQHFLNRYARKYNAGEKSLSADAVERMQAYAWPGNVRELEHAIERAVIMGESNVLGPDDFMLSIQANSHSGGRLQFSSLDLETVEKEVVRFVLERHDGNVSHAAKELGITRTSLYRRMEKYEL